MPSRFRARFPAAAAAAATRKLRGRLGGPTRVKVGLPKGSADYPDGTSVIDVGVWNEFGTTNVPERSFLRSTMIRRRGEYRSLLRKLANDIAAGRHTAREALELLGTKAASDVREAIVELRSPPNAPRTIARKGSSNPLIDTGHMRQEVTHQVVERGR